MQERRILVDADHSRAVGPYRRPSCSMHRSCTAGLAASDQGRRRSRSPDVEQESGIDGEDLMCFYWSAGQAVQGIQGQCKSFLSMRRILGPPSDLGEVSHRHPLPAGRDLFRLLPGDQDLAGRMERGVAHFCHILPGRREANRRSIMGGLSCLNNQTRDCLCMRRSTRCEDVPTPPGAGRRRSRRC